MLLDPVIGSKPTESMNHFLVHALSITVAYFIAAFVCGLFAGLTLKINRLKKMLVRNYGLIKLKIKNITCQSPESLVWWYSYKFWKEADNNKRLISELHHYHNNDSGGIVSVASTVSGSVMSYLAIAATMIAVIFQVGSFNMQLWGWDCERLKDIFTLQLL